MDTTCPRCGSSKIIRDQSIYVEVQTGGGPGGGTAGIKILGAPNAWMFTDATHGGLHVNICGECGHAEMHVSNFQKLYEKYEKTRQS